MENNTEKWFCRKNIKKGFATVLIVGMVILVSVVIGEVGSYLTGNKQLKENTSNSNQSSEVEKTEDSKVNLSSPLTNMTEYEAMKFFNGVVSVRNNTPESIEFLSNSSCADYKVPSGYELKSCESGKEGSYDKCEKCISDIELTSKYLPVSDVNFTNGFLKDHYYMPNDLLGLGNLNPWMVVYNSTKIEGYTDCKKKKLENNYDLISLRYFVPYNIENAVATSEINKLNSKVIKYMKDVGWPVVSVNDKFFSSSPDTFCYEKNGVVFSYTIGTGRCTMNTPCRAYDTLAANVYIRSMETTDSIKNSFDLKNKTFKALEFYGKSTDVQNGKEREIRVASDAKISYFDGSGVEHESSFSEFAKYLSDNALSYEGQNSNVLRIYGGYTIKGFEVSDSVIEAKKIFWVEGQ